MNDANPDILKSSDRILNSYAKKKILADSLSAKSFYLLIFLTVSASFAFFENAYNFTKLPRELMFYSLLILFFIMVAIISAVNIKLVKLYYKRRRDLIREIDLSFRSCRLLLIFDLLNLPAEKDFKSSAVRDISNKYFCRENKPQFFSFNKMKSFYRRVVISVLILTAMIYPDTMRNAFNRIIDYRKDFLPNSSHDLVMDNASVYVQEQDSVTIICRSSGSAPDIVSFKKIYSDGSGAISTGKVNGGNGIFIVKEIAQKSFICFFESEETVSDTCAVTVLKRPEIELLRITAKSPAYTKIPEKEYLGTDPNISVYKGTRMIFSVKTDHAGADSAVLNLSGDKRKKMTDSGGGSFILNYQVERSEDFYFSLYREEHGIRLENKMPVVQRIEVLSDEFPFVNLVLPEEGMLLDDAMEIPVLATASDDFGISRILLFMRKISVNRFSGKTVRSEYIVREMTRRGQTEGISIVTEYVSCRELNLLPEDRVELFLRVYDNDNISGPKFTDSNIRTVIIPSLEQLFAAAGKNYDTQKEKLRSELDRNTDIIQKVAEMSEKLKRNQELNWEDKNKIDQIKSGQEKMVESLSELEKEINRNISLLEENSILSEETLKKYVELQKLVEDLFSQDIKEKLKKMNEMYGREDLDKKSLAELLKDFEQQQKSFKEGLDKSIEILNQIKNEYLLDKLIRQIDGMITAQTEVNKSLPDPDVSANDQINRENRIEESYGIFEEELKNSVRELKEKDFEKVVSGAEEKNVKKDISQITEHIKAGKNEAAGKKGTEAVSKMLEIKKDLSEVKEKMLNRQKEELKREIEQVISELIGISVEIERLKNFSRDLSSDSGHSSRIIREFSRIGTRLENSGNRIFDISKRSFFIGRRIIAQIGSVTDLYMNIAAIFSNRQFSSSFERNRLFMGGVNRLIVLLSDAADEMDRSDSPSGLEEMLKKMEEIARRQAELNQQSSQAMSASQGESMSRMQEMMSRLAMEQAQLYEALMKMQAGMSSPGKDGKPGTEGQPGSGMEQGGMSGRGAGGFQGQQGNSGAPAASGPGGEGTEGGGGLGKKLGNIGSDMKEIEKQLADKKLDESLLSKQNQVLEKLLETIESAKREKLDRKRESRTGSQKALDPGHIEIKQTDDLKEMLIRSLRDGYSNEYKIKIKRYFRELEN